MNLSKQLSIFFVLILVAGTACTDLFNKSENGPQLEFTANAPTEYPVVFNGDTLTYHEGWEPGDAPPSFAAQVKEGHIMIDGYFKMANSCYKPNNSLNGNISRSKDTITITVKDKVKESKGSCPDHPGPLLIYNAGISKLDTGSFRIRIVHINDVWTNPAWRDYDYLGQGNYLMFDEEFVVE